MAHHSPLSRFSPGGNSANFSRCSGRNGSEIACSSLNHFPRSTSLQRREQKGPCEPANQSPTRLHVGHFTFIAAKITHISLVARASAVRIEKKDLTSPGNSEFAWLTNNARAGCLCHGHFGLTSSVTLVRSVATADAFSVEAPPLSNIDWMSFTIASF